MTFLRLLYGTHKPETFLEHIPQFIDHVIACVGDNYYKINAEALRLCATLIEVIAAVSSSFLLFEKNQQFLTKFF